MDVIIIGARNSQGLCVASTVFMLTACHCTECGYIHSWHLQSWPIKASSPC